MSAKITYNDAFTELQQIVSDIENGDINIDALGEKNTPGVGANHRL